MKTIFFIPIFTFLAMFNLYSQNNELYEFDKIFSKRQILKGKKTKRIQEVSNGNVSESRKVALKNPEYAKLEKALEIAKQDSIVETADYNKALNKFNSTLSIKEKLNAYNKSAKPFELKKLFLKDAQILATKNNIKGLFYADNTINQGMKTKFLILSLNATEMKVHLNKLQWKLKTFEAPEEKAFNSIIVLNNLREKMSKTNPVVYTYKKYSKNSLKLLNKEVDPTHLIGRFKLIGNYSVIKTANKGLKVGQLIKNATASKLKIEASYLRNDIGKKLMEHVETKKRYLVDDNFLKFFTYVDEESLTSF